MKTFYADLTSLSWYAQGKHHITPKLPQELEQAYEERCVLQKLHTAAGEVYIPPMAFKLCLLDTARYLSMPIPGKGKSTYTKHFKQGVQCTEPIMVGLKAEEVRIEKVFTLAQPNNPKSGRVWKWFPIIEHWAGTLQILAIDDIFTIDVIRKHLQVAGGITGIGVWRPASGGLWGKFKLEDVREETL